MTNVIQPTFFQNVYQGVHDGAAKGALTGMSVVAGVTAFSGAFTGLEKTHRALGGAPKWPLDKADCNLPQFRNLPFGCLENPIFSSYPSFVAYAVGSCAISGALVGGVKAAVQHLFAKVKPVA